MSRPFISIIIPARNEEQFIGKSLRSIFNSDYPREYYEIIVVDGMSEDKTIDIINKFKVKYDNLKLLRNPKKITPVARNLGVKAARGDYIMIFDAHSTAPKDYIQKCVEHITETGADNVGGIVCTVPRENTLKGRVIARILSSEFGVGGSKFRIGATKPEEVDTVPFGFYRRNVFDRIGYFNENLIRNQDIEFNLRLKRAGGKILLFPDIQLVYLSRSTFKSFWKNNFLNGFWVIYSSKFADTPFSIRHLIPFFFLIFLITGGLLAFVGKFFMFSYFTILGFYFLLDILFSLKIARKERNIKAFFLALFGFISLHISYGLGSLIGFLKLGGKK